MKVDREYRAVLGPLLAELGIAEYRVVMGGKHPHLEFQFQGRDRSFSFAGTPSDRRSVKNFLSDIRHGLGMTPAKAAEDDPLPPPELVAACRARVAAAPPSQMTDKDRRALELLEPEFLSAVTIGRLAKAGDPGPWAVERLERLVHLGLAEGDGEGRYRVLR